MVYLITVILVALSALFSGLTLGLLSLDVHDMKRRAGLGNPDAQKVYPIRKKGNLLLTTLLLGNAAVNASLSIFLGSVAPGVIAGLIATGLIFVFGEIIPEAVMVRYGLWFGARTTWIVRPLIILSSPITFPIAYILDWVLGEEMPTVYSKHELMQIISEHEDLEDGPIDEDEERILHGALLFSHTRAREVMTPLSEIVMFRDTQVLDEAFRKEVMREGYSRFPVYHDRREQVIGILYVKDMLTEETDTTIATSGAFSTDFLTAKPGEHLDTLLTRMLKQKRHMCIVNDANGNCLGEVTLEDVIEEIIQFEIEDEADKADNVSK